MPRTNPSVYTFPRFADDVDEALAAHPNNLSTAVEDIDLNGPIHRPSLSELTVPTANVSMNGFKLASVGAPTADTDAATKAYVDTFIAGLDLKQEVRAATTANITLSGAQTIDGVAVVAGNRVLVKNQTTGSQNGIYDCASGAWTRSAFADTDAEVNPGMFCLVLEGTSNAAKGFVLTTVEPITVGTTSLVFVQFSQQTVTPTYDYAQSSDPGAVGAGKTWLDKSVAQWVVKVRNDANSGWNTLSGASGGAGGIGLAGVPGLEPLTTALTWCPVFGRNPIVSNFVALRTVNITSNATWNSAIAAIIPGDDLVVARNTILTSGATRLIVNKDGTALNPWRIRFLPGARLQDTTNNTGSNPVLGFDLCSYGIIQGLHAKTWRYAMYGRQSDHLYFDSCKIWDIGESGYHFRDDCSYLDFWNCAVWDTAKNLNLTLGEGFYIGSYSGSWATAGVVIDPATSGQDNTHHVAIRECQIGYGVSPENVEFKEGTSFCYAIGNVASGPGYLYDQNNQNWAQFNSKGDDSFFYFNTVFNPSRAAFHSVPANPATTLGSGYWGKRHTYYGNTAFMSQTTFVGATLRVMIALTYLTTNDPVTGVPYAPVIYDNNEVDNTAQIAALCFGSTTTASSYALTQTP